MILKGVKSINVQMIKLFSGLIRNNEVKGQKYANSNMKNSFPKINQISYPVQNKHCKQYPIYLPLLNYSFSSSKQSRHGRVKFNQNSIQTFNSYIDKAVKLIQQNNVEQCVRYYKQIILFISRNSQLIKNDISSVQNLSYFLYDFGVSYSKFENSQLIIKTHNQIIKHMNQEQDNLTYLKIIRIFMQMYVNLEKQYYSAGKFEQAKKVCFKGIRISQKYTNYVQIQKYMLLFLYNIAKQTFQVQKNYQQSYKMFFKLMERIQQTDPQKLTILENQLQLTNFKKVSQQIIIWSVYFIFSVMCDNQAKNPQVNRQVIIEHLTKLDKYVNKKYQHFYPNLVQFYAIVALCYKSIEQWKTAIEFATKSIAIKQAQRTDNYEDQQLAMLYFQRGLMCYYGQDFDNGIKSLEKYMDIQKRFGRFQQNLRDVQTYFYIADLYNMGQQREYHQTGVPNHQSKNLQISTQLYYKAIQLLNKNRELYKPQMVSDQQIILIQIQIYKNLGYTLINQQKFQQSVQILQKVVPLITQFKNNGNSDINIHYLQIYEFLMMAKININPFDRNVQQIHNLLKQYLKSLVGEENKFQKLDIVAGIWFQWSRQLLMNGQFKKGIEVLEIILKTVKDNIEQFQQGKHYRLPLYGLAYGYSQIEQLQKSKHILFTQLYQYKLSPHFIDYREHKMTKQQYLKFIQTQIEILSLTYRLKFDDRSQIFKNGLKMSQQLHKEIQYGFKKFQYSDQQINQVQQAFDEIVFNFVNEVNSQNK